MVVNSSDFLNTESDLDLLPCTPLHKLKKSYDHTWKFQLKWAIKLPWAKCVLATSHVLHNVTCKVYNTIDRKPSLLAPKWDTLMKHEGKKKVEKDFPKLNVKKGD
jgi:hypothetical protein